jgi:hypothetical protein
LPRSLLPRLPQHLLFDLGGVLIGQIERLRVEDARFASVIRPCSTAASAPRNRVVNEQASFTRAAAVRAETRNISPTSATAES